MTAGARRAPISPPGRVAPTGPAPAATRHARTPADTPRRARIPAAMRERMIVDEAIAFFAEEGFDGQLRTLAARLGIRHSVLFRHFPSKEILIARVYQELYLRRWRPEWSEQLRDRSRPLATRLLEFYRAYTAAIFRDDWIRIFMFAGLKGVAINAPYLSLLREHVMLPICAELRAAAGLPPPEKLAPSPEEIELAWGLHGRIFYIAIRKFIYRVEVPDKIDIHLQDAIAAFLDGVPTLPSASAPTAMPTPSARPARPETPAPPRRRMTAAQREQLIVREAIGFFAEHGIDGQLRELARRIGVTHPLLYRYFPTKAALLDRVYQEVYAGRWQPRWQGLLRERAHPLRARLVAFYTDYLATIDSYEWSRIFIFSSLHGADISRRYLAIVRREIIEPVAAELRLAGNADTPERALELAWGLHGQIFYIAIRRWVYDLPGCARHELLVEATISCFLDGAARALRLLAPAGPALSSARAAS
jgi:AcrR family transcriptional regulator